MQKLLTVIVAAAVLLSIMTAGAESQGTASEARDKREQVRAERAAAAKELDAAKADDEAVHAALLAITASVNAQQADIDEAQRRLEGLRADVAAAEAAIVDADLESQALNDELVALAVAGFVTGESEEPSLIFQSEDIMA